MPSHFPEQNKLKTGKKKDFVHNYMAWRNVASYFLWTAILSTRAKTDVDGSMHIEGVHLFLLNVSAKSSAANHSTACKNSINTKKRTGIFFCDWEGGLVIGELAAIICKAIALGGRIYWSIQLKGDSNWWPYRLQDQRSLGRQHQDFVPLRYRWPLTGTQ